MATMSAEPHQTDRRYHRRGCVPAAAATLRRPADRQLSSSAGSLTKTSDFANPDLIALGYVPSKTALTSLTIQYARSRGGEHPRQRGMPALRRDGPERLPWRTQHQRGRRAGRRMATIPADGPTGTVTGDQGPVAW